MSQYIELGKAIKEIRKRGLARKGDGKEWYESAYQKSLTFYAFNDCNKGVMKSGSNHVQIYFVFNKPRGTGSGQAYYVMEYSKNIPKREGVLPSKFKDTPTAIQLPLDTFNPPKFENNKLKVTYNDKNGKLCNVTLGPCSTPEKETEYKCPVRGPNFVDDEDWEEKVTFWFKTRVDAAKTIARIPVEWQGKEPTLAEAMAPLTDPNTVSQNPHLAELSAQVEAISKTTDKEAEATGKEAEKHLETAEQQMKEHDEAMKEHDKIVGQTLGITSTTSEEEQKIGGKKSRKKRRTKRRKSNRRKKGKKSKKH